MIPGCVTLHHPLQKVGRKDKTGRKDPPGEIQILKFKQNNYLLFVCWLPFVRARTNIPPYDNTVFYSQLPAACHQVHSKESTPITFRSPSFVSIVCFASFQSLKKNIFGVEQFPSIIVRFL